MLGEGLYGLVHVLGAAWVIYDVFTKNKKLPENYKIIWAILAVIGGIITAAVYYLMYYYKKK
jgi:hypothetical protein